MKLLVALKRDYGYNYELVSSKLDLGDIIISTNEDEELMIIERKSLNDLASSIKDGRYAEQSYRLNGVVSIIIILFIWLKEILHL